MKHFFCGAAKRTIYLKILDRGTESRKNLKLIYRKIELRYLARAETYHPSTWMAIIISIVIVVVGKTKLYL